MAAAEPQGPRSPDPAPEPHGVAEHEEPEPWELPHDWQPYPDLAPPNIMWPERGSGFEPDVYSPAGQAQTGWAFYRGATSTPRRRRVYKCVTVGVVLFILFCLLWRFV